MRDLKTKQNKTKQETRWNWHILGILVILSISSLQYEMYTISQGNKDYHLVLSTIN